MNVTEDERTKYREYVNSLIRDHLSARPPPRLWHYTTGAALIEIVKSKELWSTQVSCLNDLTELRYSQNVLVEAFRRLSAARPPSASEKLLFDRVETGSTHDPALTSGWFVACLSEKADDLSQWRAYGFGEGGVAIGFDVEIILRLMGRVGQLAPVNYDTNLHTLIADNIALQSVTFFNEGLSVPGRVATKWLDDFSVEWARHLIFLEPVVKHPAFKDEQEWRLVTLLSPEEVSSMRYVQKRTLMSRHLPLVLQDPEGARVLPIAEIVVGPCRHPDVTRISISDLLRTYGYPEGSVLVRNSIVPYQSL